MPPAYAMGFPDAVIWDFHDMTPKAYAFDPKATRECATEKVHVIVMDWGHWARFKVN
jgi:hypothetical protein